MAKPGWVIAVIVSAMVAAPAFAESEARPAKVECSSRASVSLITPLGLRIGHQVILTNGTRTFGVAAAHRRPYRYVAKFPVWFKSGGPETTVTVTGGAARAAAISFGSPRRPSTAVLISCRRDSQWLMFIGGIYVRQPTCVLVRFASGGRTHLVRVGVKRVC